MFCKNCGATIPDDAKFCASCGASLSTQQTPGTQQEYQPNFNQTPYAAPIPDEGKGFAIASLVLGILSFVIFGYILGVLAIIFGAVAKNKGSRSPLATAGIVLGIIAIVLLVLLTVVSIGTISYYYFNMF